MTSATAIMPPRHRGRVAVSLDELGGETKRTTREEARHKRRWLETVHRRPHLRANSYRLAHFIARLYNPEKGYAWPPQQKLMELLGCERNTLRAAIEQLEEAGLLEVRRGIGRGRASEYVLRFPAHD